MRYVLIALSMLVVTSCRTNERWVREEVVNCPGGRVDQQRRIVDTRPDGVTRTTLIRTNTCLE